MKLRLTRLALRNFKGISEFTIEVQNGNSLFIYGANRAGKTTIADAVSWLLFGKDSAGQAQFEIKTLSETGEALHNLEHEVKATFINDDKITSLRRVYVEKYTKKRGSIDEEFTGHTTTYFVDDVPVTMSQYKAKVAEIAITEDRFQLLTNPATFVSLPWKKQRELLVEICGDISDADIVTANPELAGLPAILSGKSCDDFKLVVMGQRKKINEEIEGIPGKISVLTESLPQLEVTNASHAIDNLTKLRGQLEVKNAAIATARTGGGAAEIISQIAVIDGKIQDLKNSISATNNAALQVKRDDLIESKDRLADLRRDIRSAEADVSKAKAEITATELTISLLRGQYAEIKGCSFTGEHCPTCKQILPADQLEQARGEFNQSKAERLEENISKGKEKKARLNDLVSFVTVGEEEIAAANILVADREKAVSELEEAIRNFEETTPGIEDTPEYQELSKQRAALVARFTEIESGKSSTIDGLIQEKAVIQAEIDRQEGFVAAIDQSNQLKTKIEELKAAEKRLAGEYAALEKQLFLVESFIRAKVSALETRINAKFRLVNWKLFNEQINGGLTEVCECMRDGVPYSNLNGAGKVQAGLDIINALSEHYDCYPMVFVDNRESVTEIPEMYAQVISLIVSPEDKVLRVESEERPVEMKNAA